MAPPYNVHLFVTDSSKTLTIFFVNSFFNFFYFMTPSVHIRRQLRLIHTDTSVGSMLVYIATEQAFMAKILITLAVAIELI
jgi:hypothetical protein